MIYHNRPQPRPAPPLTPRLVWPAWVTIPAPEMGLGEVQRDRDDWKVVT